MAFVTSGFEDSGSYNLDSVDEKIRTAIISSSELVPYDMDAYTFSILQMNSRLALKSDISHTHDSSYNTKSEITAYLASKSDTDHTHATPVPNVGSTPLTSNEEVWLQPEYEHYILTACDDDPILYAINTTNYGTVPNGKEFTFYNATGETITISSRINITIRNAEDCIHPNQLAKFVYFNGRFIVSSANREYREKFYVAKLRTNDDIMNFIIASEALNYHCAINFNNSDTEVNGVTFENLNAYDYTTTNIAFTAPVDASSTTRLFYNSSATKSYGSYVDQINKSMYINSVSPAYGPYSCSFQLLNLSYGQMYEMCIFFLKSTGLNSDAILTLTDSHNKKTISLNSDHYGGDTSTIIRYRFRSNQTDNIRLFNFKDWDLAFMSALTVRKLL